MITISKLNIIPMIIRQNINYISLLSGLGNMTTNSKIQISIIKIIYIYIYIYMADNDSLGAWVRVMVLVMGKVTKVAKVGF